MRHTFKRFETNQERTYYVAVDVCNAADLIYVDTHNPHSRGFGGSTLEFNRLDGIVDRVKGPWHTNSTAFLHNTGIDIEDLHSIRIVLWTMKQEVREIQRHERQSDGKLKWGRWPTVVWEKDKVLYEEKEPVLSDFYRGERIAHAIAALREEPIYLDSYSEGGSSHHAIHPGETQMHPLAVKSVNRNADRHHD